MKYFLSLVLSVLFLSSAFAQSCACHYGETIQPASYWNNDFNCYEYVRAYHDGGHWGFWVPPKTNTIAADYPNGAILNDPNFEVVDPSLANAIYYPCGHAAVVLHSGCLIEKVGLGSELRKYGITYGSCGAPTNATYLRWIGRSGPGIDESCLDGDSDPDPDPIGCSTVSTTWVSGGSGNVNTFNYTSSYFNSIQASCTSATSFQWTRTNGSAYYGCQSSTPTCSKMYFYLNSGQSVTFNVKAKNGSTIIAQANYTFYRSSSGGGWYYTAEQVDQMEESRGGEIAMMNVKGMQSERAPLGDWLSLYPNPARDYLSVEMPLLENTRLEVLNIHGQKIYQREVTSSNTEIDLTNIPNGMYFLNVYDDTQGLLSSKRFVVKK